MALTEEQLTTKEEALELVKNFTEAQQNALYIATFKYIVEVENGNGDIASPIYKENCTLYEALEFLRETGHSFRSK